MLDLDRDRDRDCDRASRVGSSAPGDASTAQRVVCVLGMHRSGTSVVASLLEGLGVHLGAADDLLRPLPENPRGYWEHRAIKDVNEALLARLGGRWHTPPMLRDGWHRASGLDELRVEARALRSAALPRARLLAALILPDRAFPRVLLLAKIGPATGRPGAQRAGQSL
jgi:hypothetical protein